MPICRAWHCLLMNSNSFNQVQEANLGSHRAQEQLQQVNHRQSSCCRLGWDCPWPHVPWGWQQRARFTGLLSSACACVNNSVHQTTEVFVFPSEMKSWVTDGLLILSKWVLVISEAGEWCDILIPWCHKSTSADFLFQILNLFPK